MKTLVTGATGFIGTNIVRELLSDGREVRVLVRPGANLLNLKRLDVEIHEGDILNSGSVLCALKGCDVLYHAAADYRLWAADVSEMFRTNIDGTKVVLEAALKNGVSRVVYTSSVGTLGNPGDWKPGDEDTEVSLSDMVGPYKKSKFLAEREAEKFVARGLDLVIVNPSTPIGPWDIKPTPTGKIIVDFLKHRMPAYLDTGLNLVAVEDCARGHILAELRGETGKRYILGNTNIALCDMFKLLQEITGIRAPRIRLPFKPLLAAAWLNEKISIITGAEPLIPLAGVQMAAKYMYFDSSRAVMDLGLPQSSIKGALERSVDWFVTNDYV
ncbi:MAG: NAD-dependent epimerase/dehydratase family protein [Desulfuromonadaceae bacterium]|nr:NAD-dependent epimerase/dehydratase family protein [Desulfuromonadaceae bacterium]MDD2856636.1 NAD-dependent epimerase/dehydratase family protein [Desulfuromonadaceae bacterium]